MKFDELRECVSYMGETRHAQTVVFSCLSGRVDGSRLLWEACINLFIQYQEVSKIEMAHGNVQRQNIYSLGQVRLESLGTTSSNRAPLPAPGDR